MKSDSESPRTHPGRRWQRKRPGSRAKNPQGRSCPLLLGGTPSLAQSCGPWDAGGGFKLANHSGMSQIDEYGCGTPKPKPMPLPLTLGMTPADPWDTRKAPIFPVFQPISSGSAKRTARHVE